MIELAIRWILDQGVEIAIWGARRPDQLEPIDRALGWNLGPDVKKEIDCILKRNILYPQSPVFMAPPNRNINKPN